MAHPPDFEPVGTSSPAKTPFSGTHFSDSPVDSGLLEGARRGSSVESSDSHRLHLGPGAPSGVHVYREAGHPQVSGRKFAHKVVGDKAIANIETEPTWKSALNDGYQKAIQAGSSHELASHIAVNHAERALRDKGWDGYESHSQPGSVFLFGDHPVVPQNNK